MSRIILTDIHGCYKTLLALVAKLPKGIPITFAGDLLDRGPDSCKVIEFVKTGGHDCVLGNHEVMMIDEISFGKDKDGDYFVVKGYNDGIWLMNGGAATLQSYENEYGEEDLEKLREHLDWFKTLPYHIEYPDLKNEHGDHLLVTHTTAADAWGRYLPDTDKFKVSVTWDRKQFPSKIPGIYNVYGHTPQPRQATIKEHFACIDTGACYNNPKLNKLTALQWPEMVLFEQENIEDEKT